MEKNLWKALHCNATKTELSVLALYGQAISHPYLKEIRQSGDKQNNMLDLGDFHHKVHKHMQDLIRTPDLLIGSDSTYKTGSLDGKEWHNPEVVAAIMEIAPQLPLLRDLLIVFLNGASET